jgi:hypothetical protein
VIDALSKLPNAVCHDKKTAHGPFQSLIVNASAFVFLLAMSKFAAPHSVSDTCIPFVSSLWVANQGKCRVPLEIYALSGFAVESDVRTMNVLTRTIRKIKRSYALRIFKPKTLQW